MWHLTPVSVLLLLFICLVVCLHLSFHSLLCLFVDLFEIDLSSLHSFLSLIHSWKMRRSSHEELHALGKEQEREETMRSAMTRSLCYSHNKSTFLSLSFFLSLILFLSFRPLFLSSFLLPLSLFVSLSCV